MSYARTTLDHCPIPPNSYPLRLISASATKHGASSPLLQSPIKDPISQEYLLQLDFVLPTHFGHRKLVALLRHHSLSPSKPSKPENSPWLVWPQPKKKYGKYFSYCLSLHKSLFCTKSSTGDFRRELWRFLATPSA
ncbi:hypothetical protein U1Q18_032403 [Sarracenia purpurea var. burkii]